HPCGCSSGRVPAACAGRRPTVRRPRTPRASSGQNRTDRGRDSVSDETSSPSREERTAMVTLARSLALAFFVVLVSSVPGHAACDPSTDPDKTDIANVRAAVAAHCDCSALSHGAYVSCAAQQANTVLVNKSCAGFVKKCAAHSVCGRPAGAVTCCLTSTKGTTCRVKPDAAHCTVKQGTVGTCASCCDACP